MNNLPTINELFYDQQPIHIFEYDGKTTFLAQEVAGILGIKDAAASLRESKTLEKGVDYETITPNLLPVNENFSFTSAKHVSILYLSGFFLFVLRSNKPIAVPFTRWAIREAIPQAFQQKPQTLELSEATLVKLVKEERQGSGIARQMLAVHGWKENTVNRQLTIDGGSHE